MSDTSEAAKDLTDFTQITRDILDRVGEAIKVLLRGEPQSLYTPMKLALEARGKGIRPLLTALTARAESVQKESLWMHSAVSIELLHNFTLVHDDIMDNALTRRNKPTLHVSHGTSAAILTGDAIIALAFESLAQSQPQQIGNLLQEFSMAFRLVCEGQALDKEFENSNAISIDDYIHMIDLKTAKILECAAVLGAITADSPNIEIYRTFAHHLGIAFQIYDDLLDLTAEHPKFGKPIGGDILEGKRTFLFVTAQKKRESFSRVGQDLMDRIEAHQATASDIETARKIFQDAGILAEASHYAEKETNKAFAVLDQLGENLNKNELRQFGNMLLHRTS